MASADAIAGERFDNDAHLELGNDIGMKLLEDSSDGFCKLGGGEKD